MHEQPIRRITNMILRRDRKINVPNQNVRVRASAGLRLLLASDHVVLDEKVSDQNKHYNCRKDVK